MSCFLEKIIVFLSTLSVLLPSNPAYSPFTYRDSGVFLYTGWRILNGEIPYVNIWDHKPPIIYYINALGLAISNNSRWGVWVLEFISLYIAVYLGFRLMKKIFGSYAAIIGTFIWVFSLSFLIVNGNLTEEYILPLQFGALIIFYRSSINTQKKSLYFLIGVLGGLALFLKQTSIGIWVAIVTYLFIFGIKEKTFKNNIIEIFLICFGGLVIAIVVCGYFFAKGAIFEFWESAFVFNFFYSTRQIDGLVDRLWKLLDFRNITQTGILQLALLGIIGFIFTINRKALDKNSTRLLSVALIALPFELLLINLPGITYEHYFITLLPVLALFSGLLFYILDKWISKANSSKYSKSFLTILTVALLISSSFRDYYKNIQNLRTRPNEPAIQYVIANSDSKDSILVWGAETMVNYFSQRKSPTRFVYQYPLYKFDFASEEKILEFLDDLILNKPKIILDSMDEDMPLFDFPLKTQSINEKIEYLQSIYVITDQIQSWQVYQLNQE